MSLLVNSVTSFSSAPLVGIFYLGVAISLLALVYIAYLVTNWLLLEKPMSGWTSVMGSIWLLGGMVISFIGVVGIYLSKIFSEIKRRPYTIVGQAAAKTSGTGHYMATMHLFLRLPELLVSLAAWPAR